MSERTTSPSVDGGNVYGNKSAQQGYDMHVQHSHDVLQAQVIVVGGNEGRHAHYMACVGHVKSEDWLTTQIRWDDFARQMYAIGVEPVTDTPVYSVDDGDVVWDHYLLHTIEDEDDLDVELPLALQDYRLDTND